MVGLNLVQHAFATIFGNLANALKASVVPFALVLLIIFIFPVPFLAPAQMAVATEADVLQFMQENGFEILTNSAITALVMVFAFGWVAVTWHRFILLEEYPALVPAISGRPIFRYLWRSFQAGMILTVMAAIPLLLMAMILTGTWSQEPAQPGSTSVTQTVVTLALGALLSFAWLRIAIDLPGTAKGEPVGFRDAWTATAPLSGAIFGVSVILVAFNLVVGAVLPLIIVPGSLGGQILGLMAQWLTLMVGVSILTTLYGHIIEGRDLT